MSEHGTVKNVEGTNVYVVTAKEYDADACERTRARLLELDASWTEAEHTETEDVEEIVTMAIAALNLGAAEAEYHELHDDEKVDVMEVSLDGLPEGSAAEVCARLVAAQYVNGRDYDHDTLGEAVEVAKSVVHAPLPSVS